MHREERKPPLRINVDEDVENSDWPKATYDLMPYRSPEFMRFIAFSGLSLEAFKRLPVYYHAVRNGLIDPVTDEWRGEGPQTDADESEG